MLSSRVAVTLACVATFAASACGGTASSTTSPSTVAADATINESFGATIDVGGGVFYSFSMQSYGNVAVTLTAVTGTDLPDDITLGLGIGRPSGTSCTTSLSTSATPGATAQLTGVYGPGVFCVRVYDAGTLSAPIQFTASVAHS
ncbi:MAG: hypothetical protein JSU08_05540 [Acidobacteria bacterium]|nr:hypothetical protein [Acidobacteriota bacterium]